MNVLLIDNYDSFTYMLRDQIEQCASSCIVIRNDAYSLMEMDLNKFDALVISPGPQKPDDAGMLKPLLVKWVQHKPVLGICLGHQALGEIFGAKLEKAILPRHGKVDEMKHNGNVLFDKIPENFYATRYHSLVLVNLPDELELTCLCKTEIMGFAHKTLPVWGLQFHPESCQTEFGLELLKNFFIQVKKIAHS
ncbi:MAG: aminodeoxychorismate/anthranilate synthase component II [Bacteroidia bacterium]|nr:aminodeoxychorismate/anthranilate synthase component II [Bacteroidia bacterium]